MCYHFRRLAGVIWGIPGKDTTESGPPAPSPPVGVRHDGRPAIAANKKYPGVTAVTDGFAHKRTVLGMNIPQTC